MRKNIITSAFILGTIGAQAGSSLFESITMPVELSNGTTIEIMLQQEMPEPEYSGKYTDIKKELSRSTLDYEETLKILNQITKPEKEVEEDFGF